MKKNYRSGIVKFFFIVLTVLLFAALSPKQSKAYIVGASPFQDSIWIFNDPSWTVFSGAQLTLASFTVEGATSVTWNPVNGLYYAIVRVTGGPRRLATVNPETGVCTDIGSMGGNFSSITFSPTGILYAFGGNGSGAFSERLYTVDITTGVPTFLGGPYSLGFDGEVIAYNSDDNFLYHWSGNSSANMGRIDLNTLTETLIPQSGAAHGEIFGAVYKGAGEFYATDINSRALTITTAGAVSVAAIDLPDDIRGLGYGDALLPVELSSFTSSVSGNEVTLNWTTSSETNNARFEIERSSENSVWIKAGYVNGNGTTTLTQNYSFTDRGLNTGVYNYRLKQIDYNGNFEYFNLNNEIIIGSPVQYELSQNYPNPFNPSTLINYSIPGSSSVKLVIYNALGSEISVLVNENQNPGNYTVEWNAAGYPSGVYFYKLSAGSFSKIKKMTLLK